MSEHNALTDTVWPSNEMRARAAALRVALDLAPVAPSTQDDWVAIYDNAERVRLYVFDGREAADKFKPSARPASDVESSGDNKPIMHAVFAGSGGSILSPVMDRAAEPAPVPARRKARAPRAANKTPPSAPPAAKASGAELSKEEVRRAKRHIDCGVTSNAQLSVAMGIPLGHATRLWNAVTKGEGA